MSILLFAVSPPLSEKASAKALYSYTDEQGTGVITDQYDRIPAKYRSRVTTIQQEDGSSAQESLSRSMTNWASEAVHSIGKRALTIPGLSTYQSQILTYAGILCVICIAAMNLSRSELVRFLSLWCLIMVGIATPVLLYVSHDGPAGIMRSKAAQIQDKQLEHLKPAQ